MEYISSDYEFLGFNFSKEIFNNENGDDLRKAIAYGIDRQEIIRKIYLGHATQTDVPINPNSFLFADESNYYGYNKELSKKFLETLGYMDKNEDGIVEDAEGKNLTLRLITNPVNEYRLRVAELIREDLKEVGIEIILDFDTEIYDHGEMTEEIAEAQCEQLNNRIYNGDFDIVLLGWQISTIPELSFMFHSSQQNLNNFIKYNNPDMDSMLEKAFNSYNKEDKLSNYMELQEFIIKELPYVSLYYRNNALIIDSNIKGELSPTFFDLYNGLEKCLIVNEIE
jgi:peptide/nickel transport system substrate-binding protein